ncbi:MAG TPA: DUF2087 domain-containing protein [Anaerolineae bacterium]|nr:DUF2087 domain-containing protein [Anaerolineae bacterium]
MTMEENALNELLAFFKTLIDPDRLAIAGRLARSSATVETLATELSMPRVDVRRHLDHLIEAGLVAASGGVYTLDRHALHAQAKRVLSSGAPAAPPATSLEKVLSDYLRPDGSLKETPSQLKKKMIVYEHIASHFEIGRHYTEKEVNELLGRFHPDVVSIRRDLFDLGLINRRQDGSDYWRSESNTF